MAETGSIRVTKQFTYRGNAHLWSNRYHFVGPPPTTQAYFDSLAATLAADEATFLGPETKVVKAELLPPGSDVPTYETTLNVTGTLTATGSAGRCPGDCAMVLRWATAARSSKNHPIYLFSYFHDVYQDATGVPDAILNSQKTALLAYGTKWLNGYAWGGGIGSIHRAGPNGASGTAVIVVPHITHRDFPS